TTARSAIKILRRFIILCAAPPFLIPHSNKAFIRDPWAAQPTGNPGLANLNPEPSFLLHFLYFLLPFHAQIVYNKDGSDLP
ncbi:MAG: hypothetical protein PUI83_03245, partial [Dialister sp.]|nr:hypothetical protein [Dialister sp.]